ncbi:hypothetical protein Q4E40_02765 [Pontibacter sp. BT731]|uniref:hypothetical protein n=1 Tax=Pontibacter coccineus TaxID=3063328 RepID=UPI0026E208F5|nr:hypothetical protein [Pontibacter sp. BT731]MDO6389035.1 hypothetical protein [Pontibacter sp. BT731]
MKGYKITYDNHGPGEYGVVVAPSAGKARYRAYLSYKDVWEEASFAAIRVHRAPEYDGLEKLRKSVYTKEWADLIKEENA